jgi:hypothetical protein
MGSSGILMEFLWDVMVKSLILWDDRNGEMVILWDLIWIMGFSMGC